jgi:crossover junction endodeoxyribonuclease RuvC
MITLGIDPGTRRVGYGVVRSEHAGELKFIEAGILDIESIEDADALCDVKKGIDALIKKHKPDVVAVEKLFFAKNQKTALAVAQARGVILLSARESKVKICEYTPNEVKSGVTGYGFADKKAVLKMVQLTLGKHDLKIIDDASDALAIAILANSPINR